jgi:two-component system response regulator VicR
MRKVAIIDDEKVLLDLYAEDIEYSFSNVEVLKFDKPATALSYLLRNPVDLIITDGVMSGMSGIEMAQELKNHKINVPIVLISGFIRNFDTATKDNLFFKVLEKPIDFDELDSIICNILSSSQNL